MAQSTDVSKAADDTHAAAMDWLNEHPEDLAIYEGEWVAVAENRVVAHGGAFDEVVREAERLGFDDPLLVPVMPYPFIGS